MDTYTDPPHSYPYSMDEEESQNEGSKEEEEKTFDSKVIKRAQWEGKNPRKVYKMKQKAKYVFCFNTFTRGCDTLKKCTKQIQLLQQTQMRESYMTDIRYNFVITMEGDVYEGRGWGVVPTLPFNFSHYSDNCVMIGFFGASTEKSLSGRAEIARDELIEYGVENNFIDPNYELRVHLSVMPK